MWDLEETHNFCYTPRFEIRGRASGADSRFLRRSENLKVKLDSFILNVFFTRNTLTP